MGRGIALAWLFLMAFALFQHACAQNDSSLVWLAKDDAFSHAQEISGTSQNLYNATERQITDSNPSRFFFARLVSMYPEANGAVSSREDTRLLFAWGESHDPEYTITGQKQYIDCNAPWSKLSFNRSSAHFTFRFNLTNGNSSLERTVESSGSENPVPIPFTEAELDSIPSYPPGRSMPALVVSLNASITYTYLVARYHEDYECSSGPDGSKGCGCVPEYGLGNQEFTYWDNDSLEMPV
ncbi:MAG TPA: hypothetical protein PLO51_05585, partial [Candidatus Micrarchaeota archaeon]|nr:hypothetical protein [Candidatus Micrarchaeota archaeon]